VRVSAVVFCVLPHQPSHVTISVGSSQSTRNGLLHEFSLSPPLPTPPSSPTSMHASAHTRICAWGAWRVHYTHSSVAVPAHARMGPGSHAGTERHPVRKVHEKERGLRQVVLEFDYLKHIYKTHDSSACQKAGCLGRVGERAGVPHTEAQVQNSTTDSTAHAKLQRLRLCKERSRSALGGLRVLNRPKPSPACFSGSRSQPCTSARPIVY
jgi:hypothetical protein